MTGCTSLGVEPWDRDILAKDEMQLVADPIEATREKDGSPHPAIVPPEDSRAAVAACLAAEQSAATGQVIQL